MRKIINLLIITLLLLPVISTAQSRGSRQPTYSRYFLRGSVVTNDGKTINGEILHIKDNRISSRCIFRTGEYADREEFSPEQLQSFRLENGQKFVSREIQTNGHKFKAFLECLTEGRLSIYYYRDSIGNRFYAEKENNGLVDLVQPEYSNNDVYQKTGSSAEFKKALTELTSDVPQLQVDINNLTVLNRSNLVQIATQYNSVTNSENSSSNSDKSRFDLIVGGGVMFTGNESKGYAKENYPLLNLGMAISTGHNFYMRSGIGAFITSGNLRNTPVVVSLKIPLFLEYNLSSTKSGVYIGAGCNIYPSAGIFDSFHTGANIMLTDHIGFKLDVDLEFFNKYIIVPDYLISTTPSAGLLFRF